MSIVRRTGLLITIALTSTLSVGCSGGKQSDAAPPATATTRPTAPPAPATGPTFTAAQARMLTTLGQRAADLQMLDPVKTGMGLVSMCPGESAFVGSESRSWIAESTIPDGQEGGLDLRTKITAVARTVNGVAVLDESPSAATVADARLRSWATCSVPGSTRQHFAVSVPGTGATIGLASTDKHADPSVRHEVVAAARHGNVLLICLAQGPRAGAPRRVATSCLKDMATGTSLLEHPARQSNPLAARVLLADVRVAKHEVVPASAASTPCPSNDKPWITAGAPAVFLRGKPRGGEPGTDSAIVMMQQVPSPEEAKRRVSALREDLRSCTRSFVQTPRTYPSPGAVDSVKPVAVGDGGVAIASHVTPFGGTASAARYAVVFSTGALLVHVEGYGSDAEMRANALTAARAAIESVKRGR